jgi:excisionase family DNA binding protein
VLVTLADQKFLTVEEAAQLVGLSHWAIRRWIQKGLLTKFKVRQRTIVSRRELLALLEPRAIVFAERTVEAGNGQ